MGRIRITSLNIKGAGGKTAAVAQTLEKFKTDILVLQETHFSNTQQAQTFC